MKIRLKNQFNANTFSLSPLAFVSFHLHFSNFNFDLIRCTTKSSNYFRLIKRLNVNKERKRKSNEFIKICQVSQPKTSKSCLFSILCVLFFAPAENSNTICRTSGRKQQKENETKQIVRFFHFLIRAKHVHWHSIYHFPSSAIKCCARAHRNTKNQMKFSIVLLSRLENATQIAIAFSSKLKSLRFDKGKMRFFGWWMNSTMMRLQMRDNVILNWWRRWIKSGTKQFSLAFLCCFSFVVHALRSKAKNKIKYKAINS